MTTTDNTAATLLTPQYLAARLTELRYYEHVSAWQLTTERGTGAPVWVVSFTDGETDTYTTLEAASMAATFPHYGECPVCDGHCPDCGAVDPMGDEDAWHRNDCQRSES